MKLKTVLSFFVCLSLMTALSGCSISFESSDESPSSDAETSEATEDAPTKGEVKDPSEEPTESEELVYQPISVGQNIQNDDFSITLTNARVDSVLESDSSPTYWEPQDGGAFVILEFDVTALNSEQLPVDDYAITELNAKYNEDSYQSWTLSYLANQLWLYFTHTYLDANIPAHVYAYTTVPAEALNTGSLSVDMMLADTPCTVTIR